jgi:uncharacterized membrane protein
MYKLISTVKEHLELLGKKPLCNKKAERAPWILNFCFPLCWRCTSIIIGYVLGSILQVSFLGGRSYLFLGSMLSTPCFVDYYLQQKGKLESTNFRRILTGLLAGIGISVF